MKISNRYKRFHIQCYKHAVNNIFNGYHILTVIIFLTKLRFAPGISIATVTGLLQKLLKQYLKSQYSDYQPLQQVVRTLLTTF